MLTETEQAEMVKMVAEMEVLTETTGPGWQVAWYKMKQLGTATGDEWETLVRRYLKERAPRQTTEHQGEDQWKTTT